ncbi:MAG: hypothetical protein ABSG57_01465 [Candidatus Bathyarchaeia archaeon]
MTEIEFKTRELERLLSEGRITLEQYLDARTRIGNSTASQTVRKHSPSKETVVHAETVQPHGKGSKKFYSKVVLGLILCSIILIGGLFAWGYLNSAHAESLTIEGYSVKLFTSGAVLFELKNSGSADVRISCVTMNGCLNQSLEGWNQGWNGTVFLQPGSRGTLYVYVPCYFYVLNSSMPSLSPSPTQAELENLYSYMESFNCTFTFVTNTQHEYNCTVPGLASVIIPAAWMGSLTYTFMATEQLQITNLAFVPGTIMVTLDNTGTTQVTIVEVWVNNVMQTSTNPPLAISVPANSATQLSITMTVIAGYQYEVKLVSSKGNTFVGTGTAPT